MAETRDNVVRLDATQVEALATRDDRRENFVALGRREDEADMRRRLLERLQKRVPCRVRKHVAFVDYEDSVRRRRRLELHGVDYGFDVFDFVVRRGVKLHDVQRAACGDLLAVDALPARLYAIGRSAVERLCEDAARRGLADAAGADEKVCVRDAVRLDRVTMF